jgi:hypothetical protein
MKRIKKTIIKKKTKTIEGTCNLLCRSPKLLCSGTMRCIDALNACMLLWRGHLPPLRHRLTPPLLRWWNLHPPTGYRIQSLQKVLCLWRTTHWPQHMRREYSASTNLKAWLWIWFYRLLAYKELYTLIWWSTRAPFPLDPPSTLSLNSFEENTALLFHFSFP